MSTVEERFRAILEGAGAKASGRDSYLLAESSSGRRIYAVLARGKERRFSNLTFVIPIQAQPTAAQPFGGALNTDEQPRSVSWLPPVRFFVETAGHRKSKARGSVRELQSGIPGFDDHVFVESSARPTEVQALLQLPELCEAVRGTLRDANARYVALRSGRGAAAVVWPNHATFADPGVAREVLRWVAQLAAALPRFESTRGRLRLGPAGFLAYASAIGALTGLICGASSSVGWRTTSCELGLHAAGAALPFYIVLLIVGRFRSRQSSSGGVRFAVIASLGLIALVGWFVGLANGLNALLDPSMKIHVAILEGKFEQKGSNRNHYYARIAPVGPVATSVDLKVDRGTYVTLPRSGSVRVRAGGGWLGYPWIDAVYPAQ